MSFVSGPRELLAVALLAGSVLLVAPEPLGAQEGMDAAATRYQQRVSGETERKWRARTERHRRLEQQVRAHAQMPDTMYASTPDPAPPPHPAHTRIVDARAKRALERGIANIPPKSAAGSGHRLAFFPAAARWGQGGYQGFARVINRTGEGGEVRIEAFDDAGMMHGPVTLRVAANDAVHFNSGDLESGNSKKGLSGSIGAGEGDWRLRLSSNLDLEVLSYIRTSDGFLTSMHDVVPETPEGHRVVIFNPGKNVNQVSRLRLVNPGDQEAGVRIEGTDDDGASPGVAVTFSLPAGASRTLTSTELESGEAEGLSGALGTGKGKWRLLVHSEQPLRVMSLLASPTGHLTNLSSAPRQVVSEGANEVHEVTYFPGASRWESEGVQGFARLVNRTEQAGEVRIEAWDDAGVMHGPVALSLAGNEAAHFNSGDLEAGNARKGLSGSLGAGEGDWRLRLSSSLDLEVLSYVRTSDGFLTSMHDVVPETPEGHWVVIFNPGKNINQVSRLRVINPGDQEAEVRIEGTDDDGASPGVAVTFSLPAGASRTLTSTELESGEAERLSGALGTGKGKWRLHVNSEQPLRVLSLLASPTGHLTNLSGVPADTESAAEVFHAHISGPIVQSKCINCHVAGGVSGNTRLVFVPVSEAGHEAVNLRAFEDFLDAVEDAAGLILNKVQGVAHGGGVQVPLGSPEFAHMQRFLRLLGEEVAAAPLTPQTLFDTVKMAPARKTLRRAAIIFAGRIPSEEEYATVAEGDEDALRATIRGLMNGPEFHEFLIRAANDRLLTDRRGQVIDINVGLSFVAFVNEAYRRRQDLVASGKDPNSREYYDWYDSAQHGFRRAPLELIAHVVENDLPYTEILTADYIMANPMAAAAYGASTPFEDTEDVHEFNPSRIVTYYRQGEGFEDERDPVTGAIRILDPGPLSTKYPHAGILNTTAYMLRYPTTATNRNRARSRWTYYHFLGLDIEKSASRTTDPVALADTNNPTMHNPACTVCHRVLDPVAGAFQNYGDEGLYRDQWGGMDSLDGLYKNEGGPTLPIRAETWEDRETLSWSVSMVAGTQAIRLVFTNPVGELIFLDRLRVRNSRGDVIAISEFEDLEPPAAHDGKCSEPEYNPATDSVDHMVVWGGNHECAFMFDVSIASGGIYTVEIFAWMSGQTTRYGGDGYPMLAVAVNAYQQGDTWYRDMRMPGFSGKVAPNSDNSVQWLAQEVVNDGRFAEAAAKFWWPAVMGSDVIEAPEDEGDAGFEGLLLAAAAQGAEVERLARGFRRGFNGRPAYNLKDLLSEIVLSGWFRADTVEDKHPVRQVALRDAGARRLLTPEELARKTAALTGFKEGRSHNSRLPHGPLTRSVLAEDYRLLYGGIDSDGIVERARDFTSVMAGVARRHALRTSCALIMRELYLLPESGRSLFSGIDRHSSGSEDIRNKLVELHEALLGVHVTPQSPDVEAAYLLFLDVQKRRRQARVNQFEYWHCEWGIDHLFFDGILNDAVVQREREDGSTYYDFDWGYANDYLERQDWSDPRYTAHAWMAVVASLMMDYRYLYL